MTRTLHDPATRGVAERPPEGLGDDPMHHPPKPASVGLGAGNEPAAGGRFEDNAEGARTDGRTAADQRSIADLLKELRDEAVHLLRQEVNLAKTELSEKASFFGTQAGKIAGGGAVLAVGALLVLSAVACAVAWIFQRFFEWLPTSSLAAGYFIVGAIIAIVGYSMYASARSRMKKEPLAPERTLQSLKDDKQWLTQKTTEATR